MGRRSINSNAGNWLSVGIILLGLLACTLVYVVISVVLKPSNSITDFNKLTVDENDGSNLERENVGECCKGIPNLELWGSAVKWGTDHKFNSAEECCKSCKAMCSGKNGPCLCDTWVFCGDRQACGSKFGEVSFIILLLIEYSLTESVNWFDWMFIYQLFLVGIW